MTPRAQLAAWPAAGLVLAVAAFFGGRTLHSDARAGYDFDTDAPAYEAAAPAEGLSLGGFSGFGDLGVLPGRTSISGRVVDISDDAIVIEDQAGARSTVRLNGEGRIYQVEAAEAASIPPGSDVVLRLDSDGEATGVLVDLTR